MIDPTKIHQTRVVAGFTDDAGNLTPAQMAEEYISDFDDLALDYATSTRDYWSEVVREIIRLEQCEEYERGVEQGDEQSAAILPF